MRLQGCSLGLVFLLASCSQCSPFWVSLGPLCQWRAILATSPCCPRWMLRRHTSPPGLALCPGAAAAPRALRSTRLERRREWPWRGKPQSSLRWASWAGLLSAGRAGSVHVCRLLVGTPVLLPGSGEGDMEVKQRDDKGLLFPW